MNDVKIKLIDKSTDISALTMIKYNWDLVINEIPYQVVKIVGYVHTIGGKNGINDLWCYPRDKEPTVKNLRQYNADEAVRWGITYEPKHYIDYKYDNGEVRTGATTYITRNGEKFCKIVASNMYYAIDKARIEIARLKEHPVGFNNYDYLDNLINRKIFFRGQPGIITSFYKGEGTIVIYPDFDENETVNRFRKPNEFRNSENDKYYDEEFITTSIFDNNIWWWRNK